MKQSPGRSTAPPPILVLGPLLRRGGDHGLAIWIETSQPCHVVATAHFLNPDGKLDREHQFLGVTFTVCDHHYAIIDIDGIDDGMSVEYELELDGHAVWPDPALGFPPARFEPWSPGDDLRISGGSCRQQAPQAVRRRPRLFGSSTPVTDSLGADALAALAQEIQRGRRAAPHLLLLTGDQVYADERHQSMTDYLRDRRGGPPADGRPEVTSFEEYTWLYRRTWVHPLVRWLLSSVPSVMIFDDHDVIDDWNISDTWQQDIATEPWWQDRLDAALMSYWVYQHLGNMSAEQRSNDALFARVRSAQDGGEILRDFARNVGTGAGRFDFSWSYRLQLGPVNIVVLDSRNGRVVEPTARSMLSPRDWDFLDEALATPSAVLLVTSVPWLLPAGVHSLERLVSQIVLGRWGTSAARVGEWIRRAIDLEHWAAYGESVDDLTERFERIADRDGYPPVVFSGDVHFAYIAHKTLASGSAYQVVSSPLRQGDARYEQVARRTAITARFDRAIRRLAARGRRRAARPQHRTIEGVWTHNNIASLTYRPSGVRAALERADLGAHGLQLSPLTDRQLANVPGVPKPGSTGNLSAEV